MPDTPLIIAADAGRANDYMGLVMDWKVTAEQTGGAFSVVEAKGSTGTEPPLHYHENADEFFFVVDGTMTFKVDDDIKKISNNGFVWIPRSVVHGFWIKPFDSACRGMFKTDCFQNSVSCFRGVASRFLLACDF